MWITRVDKAVLAALLLLSAALCAWVAPRIPSPPPPWAASTRLLGGEGFPTCEAARSAAEVWTSRVYGMRDPTSLRWWMSRRADERRFDLLAPGWRAPCLRTYGPPHADGTKVLRDVAYLATQPSCVIYSVGGYMQTEFEEAMLAATPCHVWQFDCTVSEGAMAGVIARMAAADRMHFKPYCVGPEGSTVSVPLEGVATRLHLRSLSSIMRELGHDKADVLKMDCEGCEHDALRELVADAARHGFALPSQVSVEAHVYGEDATPVAKVLGTFNALYAAGYVEVAREANPVYPACCMELTFVLGCEGWGGECAQ